MFNLKASAVGHQGDISVPWFASAWTKQVLFIKQKRQKKRPLGEIKLERKSDERVEKAGTANLLYWWSQQWSKTQANKNAVSSLGLSRH